MLVSGLVLCRAFGGPKNEGFDGVGSQEIQMSEQSSPVHNKGGAEMT